MRCLSLISGKTKYALSVAENRQIKFWRNFTMKKALLLVLALMLIISLAACGGNTDNPSGNGGNNSTNPPASQGGNDTTPSNNVDTKTVEGVLAAVGLKVDDVKPGGTTDMNTNNDSTSTGVQFWLEGTKYEDFDAAGYIDKLWDAVKAASDDGGIYNPYKLIGGTKEAIEKTVPGTYNVIDQWGYYYKSKDYNMTLGIMMDAKPGGDDDKYVLMVSLSFGG
jgi:hypothetical protein